MAFSSQCENLVKHSRNRKIAIMTLRFQVFTNSSVENAVLPMLEKPNIHGPPEAKIITPVDERTCTESKIRLHAEDKGHGIHPKYAVIMERGIINIVIKGYFWNRGTQLLTKIR